MNGGYDDGYMACSCFWGREPGRLVQHLTSYIQNFEGLFVFDAGCGEGKNAAFLANKGAIVRALDISAAAITNGRLAFSKANIRWEIGDIRYARTDEIYNIIIAYGLLHCLPSEPDIHAVVERLKAATTVGGFNVVCALNGRRQDLSSAHPGLSPTLLDHRRFEDFYSDWEILENSDSDLTEVHPHNKISHTHSLTRLLARKK